jgi:hypothetical protein
MIISLNAKSAVGLIGLSFSPAFIPFTAIGGMTSLIGLSNKATYDECRNIRYRSRTQRQCETNCYRTSSGRVCKERCYNRLPLNEWSSQKECRIHYYNKPVYNSFIRNFLVSIGLVMLDNESSFKFVSIEGNSNKELGISDYKKSVYNMEVEELNIILEEVESDLILKENKGENVSLKDSSLLWNSYSKYFSTETLEVAKIITKKFLETTRISK